MTARRSVVFASLVLLGTLVSAAGAQSQIYRPGAGIRNPSLLKEVKPNYTRGAMRERIEGIVILEAVVQKDGTVGDVRVTKSLDVNGLDAEAVRAAKQWVFKPATRNGEPVDIYVTLELAFRLRQGDAWTGAHRANEVGLHMPVVTRDVKPNYTPEGMRQKIQGIALVEVLVGADGSVKDARIAQSLDQATGLDAEALKAARQWTFQSGTLNNEAVPVVTTLEMVFRLH